MVQFHLVRSPGYFNPIDAHFNPPDVEVSGYPVILNRLSNAESLNEMSRYDFRFSPRCVFHMTQTESAPYCLTRTESFMMTGVSETIASIAELKVPESNCRLNPPILK